MRSLKDVVNENIWDKMPKIEDWNDYWDPDFIDIRTKEELNAKVWDKRNFTYRYVAITHPRLTKQFIATLSPEVHIVLKALIGYTITTLEKDYSFRSLKKDLLYTDPMFGLLSIDKNSPIVSEYYCWNPNREEEEKRGLNNYDGVYHNVSHLLPQYAKRKYKDMVTVETTEDSVTIRIAKEKGADPEAFVTFERGFYTDEMRQQGIKLPNM